MSRWIMLVAFSWMCAAEADEARLEARRHAMHAEQLADSLDLRGAIADYERAYELSPDPKDLFNIGYLHFRLGEIETSPDAALAHKREAIASLRRYLEERPNARDRAVVTQWIRKMEAELPQVQQIAAMRERERADAGEQVRQALERQRVAEARLERMKQQKADAERHRKAVLRVGLPAAGAGLLALVGGGAVLAASVAAQQTAEAARDAQEMSLGNGSALSNLGIGIAGGVLAGAGVAALGVGTFMLVNPQSAATRALWIAPSTGTLTFGGSF